MTIPEKAVPALPKGLFGTNTVVVDTGNYYPRRDGRIATSAPRRPSALAAPNPERRPELRR